MNDKFFMELFSADNEAIHKYIARLVEEVTKGTFKARDLTGIKLKGDCTESVLNDIKNELIINIEYNVYDGNNVRNNSLDYICNVIKDYRNKPKVLQINLNNFDDFRMKRFIHECAYCDIETGEECKYSLSRLIFINLNHFKNMSVEELAKATYLEKMLYFFHNPDVNLLKLLYMKDDVLMDMTLKIEEIPVFPELCYNREDYERQVLEDQIEMAQQEGLKEGIAQGRQQTKIKIAKNLLKNNFSIDDVIKYTGLSKKEINSFSNN